MDVALFEPKKRLQDLEVRLVTSKIFFDTYDQMPLEYQGRALNGLEAKLAADYRAAVAAGKTTEARSLIRKYLNSPPKKMPDGYISWSELLKQVEDSSS